MKPAKKSKRISKEDLVRKIISLEMTSDRAIAKLAEQLYRYEKKYNMRSEVFYKLIVGTPAEDNADFIEWAMCYRSYFRTLRSKFAIEGVGTGVV